MSANLNVEVKLDSKDFKKLDKIRRKYVAEVKKLSGK